MEVGESVGGLSMRVKVSFERAEPMDVWCFWFYDEAAVLTPTERSRIVRSLQVPLLLLAGVAAKNRVPCVRRCCFCWVRGVPLARDPSQAPGSVMRPRFLFFLLSGQDAISPHP